MNSALASTNSAMSGIGQVLLGVECFKGILGTALRCLSRLGSAGEGKVRVDLGQESPEVL